MKINHNMSATITNAQLLKTENSLAASMERLSSGIRINHAKDDPAGMAITNKMQSQIDGLAKSSENASNGVSVLQIADTALGEITSILQRMRELSVQAATDTNQLEDREAIQEEIASLTKEVDRISRDTEYNTKKLIDGTSDTRVYANGVTRMTITDTVSVGNYSMTIDSAATQSTALATTSAGTYPEKTKLTVNGFEIEFTGKETEEEFFEKLRHGAEKGDVTLMIVNPNAAQDLQRFPETGGYEPLEKDFEFGDTLAFVSNQFGVMSAVDIKFGNQEIEDIIGLDPTKATSGQDAEIILDRTNSSFGAQATVTTDGNRFKVTDINGFEMNFKVDAGKTGDLDIEVTDIGTMTLQIGANEHQTMDVRIPKVSSDTLYLDEIDVTKVNGGGKAITKLDEAIEITSTVRSSIGAYQNRLEYAIESLDASNEDMTAAISRIGDVDMAQEMTEYTKYTILQQAGTAALAQANDIPQTVLQLLQ